MQKASFVSELSLTKYSAPKTEEIQIVMISMEVIRIMRRIFDRYSGFVLAYSQQYSILIAEKKINGAIRLFKPHTPINRGKTLFFGVNG